VTVFHGDAIALGADGEAGGDDLASLELAEKLACFLLHLFLFVLDVGNDVAENVQGGDAGITRAADGLHGDGKDGFNAESFLQRRQRQGQSHDRAVGVGDHESAGVPVPGLRADELEMAGIDFRNDQRHMRVHAEGR